MKKTCVRGLNLVLLGPPGAGKGTQAVILASAYKLLHISTGDMLREEAKKKTVLGERIRGYMKKGELVPDDIVIDCAINRMSKPDARNGVILDGYPRTRTQAEALDESMKKTSRILDVVLYLKTSEKVAIMRLSGRRVCPKCNKNYHVINIPPKKEGICDKCGVSLIYREDDKPLTVKNRLDVYERSTKDLVEYYKEKGILREVNGALSKEELFCVIDKLFKQEGLIDDNPCKG